MFYRPHSRFLTIVDGPSMTKQSHKDECDIHNILSQFKRTGIISHIKQSGATFDDLPSDIDFQTSLHTVMEAERQFSLLPAKVRARFGNDPSQLLAALQDPNLATELRELGILKPLPVQTVEVTPTAGPEATS